MAYQGQGYVLQAKPLPRQYKRPQKKPKTVNEFAKNRKSQKFMANFSRKQIKEFYKKRILESFNQTIHKNFFRIQFFSKREV
jgi:hypothetical protein